MKLHEFTEAAGDEVCVDCGKRMSEDDVIWARPNGELSTMADDALPFCDACLPRKCDRACQPGECKDCDYWEGRLL